MASAVFGLAHQDRADLGGLALPVKGHRIVLLGQADAQRRQRKLDQGRVDVQVQPGQHRHDGRPDVVVGTLSLLPRLLGDHLANHPTGWILGGMGEGGTVEVVGLFDDPASLGDVTGYGVGPEVHVCGSRCHGGSRHPSTVSASQLLPGKQPMSFKKSQMTCRLYPRLQFCGIASSRRTALEHHGENSP